MIIDTHIHESKYSDDSGMSLEEVVKRAKQIGLDGVCITNHDNNHLRNEIGDSCYIDGVLVIVGAEILTRQGDILVFGMDKVPEGMVESSFLTCEAKKQGAITISAHPYRHNNRGLGNHIESVSESLTAVEAFNGSTYMHHNLYAYAKAMEFNLPALGASDAHVISKIGAYSTCFESGIRDHKDFIEAIKEGHYSPVRNAGNGFEKIDIFKMK